MSPLNSPDESQPDSSGARHAGGPFPVDPDIASARTIDPRAFGDEGIFRAFAQSLFPASWQLLRCPVSWVSGSCAHTVKSAALPVTLLPGSVNEPLLLTLDGAGHESLLSNVCTHRGNLLCGTASEHPQGADELVCGYHGRRFGFDGQLRSMPAFEETRDFPSDRDHLPRLELERVGPLRFTRLTSDARFSTSFDVASAPLAALLAEYEGLELRFDEAGTRDFDVQANWALYVENYLEGFHVPFVHRGLNRALDPATYRTELLPSGVRQVGLARVIDGQAQGPCLRRSAQAGVAADYLWLYPNLMVNAYPWGLSVNIVEPTGPRTCRVRYLTLIARPELCDQGAGMDLDRVEAEDGQIVERVQRGVDARLYRGGRFSPTHEQGPHWFERMLSRDLEALLGGGQL